MTDKSEVENLIESIIQDMEKKSKELIAALEQFDVKDVDSAIYKYIYLRNSNSKTNKLSDSIDSAIKGHQQALNSYLLSVSQDIGVKSFKTDSGSAFRTIKTAYRIRDWEEYSKWILETGNIHCLEKRPAKLAVQEIIAEQEAQSNDESVDVSTLLPPGLDLYQEVEFQFRK